ncbi:hypothetical protein FPQ18DRAFT_20508 [Pyronema domesticum]|nr:hypothetical protein FPQ18DRAFT_20508 [Pyronema domesticum]
MRLRCTCLLLLLPFVLLLLAALLLLLLLASPSNPSKSTGQPEGLEQVSTRTLQSHKGGVYAPLLCSNCKDTTFPAHSSQIHPIHPQATKNPRPPSFPPSAYDHSLPATSDRTWLAAVKLLQRHPPTPTLAFL